MARTPRKDTENPRDSSAGALFLGAVVARHGSGDDAPMAAEFSLLLARVNQVLGQYHAQQLSTGELAAALAAERVVALDGAEWTLGATSGSWYRRYPGERWRQVPPPDSSVVARDPLLVPLDPPSTEEGALDVPPDPFVTTGPAPEATPAPVAVAEPVGASPAPDASWVSSSLPDTDDLDEMAPVEMFDATPATPLPAPPATDFDGLGDPYMDAATAAEAETETDDTPVAVHEALDDDELLRRWLGTDSTE